MRLYARIPNLVSELKSENSWAPFWPKNRRMWQNTRIYQFSTLFLTKKGVKYYPISILRPDLESSHQGASNWLQIERKIQTLFFGPRRNFKISTTFGDQTGHFWENKLYHVNQREKSTRIGGRREEIKKKLKSEAPYCPRCGADLADWTCGWLLDFSLFSINRRQPWPCNISASGYDSQIHDYAPSFIKHSLCAISVLFMPTKHVRLEVSKFTQLA